VRLLNLSLSFVVKFVFDFSFTLVFGNHIDHLRKTAHTSHSEPPR